MRREFITHNGFPRALEQIKLGPSILPHCLCDSLLSLHPSWGQQLLRPLQIPQAVQTSPCSGKEASSQWPHHLPKSMDTGAKRIGSNTGLTCGLLNNQRQNTWYLCTLVSSPVVGLKCYLLSS
jgi:hypothetical protein